MSTYSDNDNGDAVSATCRKSVFMVGAFPPPVVGLAVVNAAVRERLKDSGVELTVINIAAKSLGRSLAVRFGRLPRIFRGLYRMSSAKGLQNAILYMSISGGFGQVNELFFLFLARRFGMRVYLHHHSFAYLDKPNWLAKTLIRVAGASTVHITQSPGMAARLQKCYSSVLRVIPISNVVFLITGYPKEYVKHSTLKTLGFISNISEEKGVFEFLDLVSAYEKEGLNLNAKLAGPFQDSETERRVRQRLAELDSIEYVGPQFGEEKEAFFASIDALIFPTKYDNETEGIVNHEAMCRNLPVIAYGRGCIVEFVDQGSGLVIDTNDDFVPEALAQIKQWLYSSETYQFASNAAGKCFASTLNENKRRWNGLLREMLECVVDASN